MLPGTTRNIQRKLRSMHTKKNIVHTKRRAPWMSKDLMNIIKRKKTLWYKNLSLKWQCPRLVNEYKEINKQIPKLTRKAIRNYEENLANDKKNRKSYSHT